MLVSFVGCVISFNFWGASGWRLGPVPLLFPVGFPGRDILRFCTMLALTFWIGAFGLAGIVFLIEPVPLPEFLPIPPKKHACPGRPAAFGHPWLSGHVRVLA